MSLTYSVKCPSCRSEYSLTCKKEAGDPKNCCFCGRSFQEEYRTPPDPYHPELPDLPPAPDPYHPY